MKRHYFMRMESKEKKLMTILTFLATNANILMSFFTFEFSNVKKLMRILTFMVRNVNIFMSFFTFEFSNV